MDNYSANITEFSGGGALKRAYVSLRFGRAAFLLIAVLLAGCSSGPVAPDFPPPRDSAAGGEERLSRAVIGQRDFQVAYRLEGVSARSTAIRLMSNRNLVFIPSAALDSAVSKGQVVGEAAVAPDIREALEAGAETSSIDRSRLDQLLALEGPLTAPVGGVLAVEDDLPVVRSPGINVVVDLTPLQDLRYQSIAFTGRAVIETVIGERNVPCLAVWVKKTEVLEPDPFSHRGASELHCRIPSHIETAPGLRAQVRLASQLVEDAVVVPNIYIGYDETTDGYYLAIVDNGSTSRLPVVVGVTDGVVRVITTPVPVGAELALPLS